MKIKNGLILSLFIITAASGCIQEQVQPPVTTQAPQSDVKTTVRIKNFVFDPTPLAIKAGTPVEWVNDDSVPHRIEFENFASHNQRGKGTLIVETDEEERVEANDLVEIIEESMSSPLYEVLKRNDELKVVVDAHKKPRFVEDVLRMMIKGLT